MRDIEANHDRLYEIEVMEDLFGRLHLVLRWGRWGKNAREASIVEPTVEMALRDAAQRVRKRASARRRVGSGYLLVHATGAEELRGPLVALWQKLGGASWVVETIAGDRVSAARRSRGGLAPEATAPDLPLFAA